MRNQNFYVFATLPKTHSEEIVCIKVIGIVNQQSNKSNRMKRKILIKGQTQMKTKVTKNNKYLPEIAILAMNKLLYCI